MVNNLSLQTILRLVGLLGLLLVLQLFPYEQAVAQTACYEDERGRIVTRRRPGYKRVVCPGEASQAEGAEAGAEPVAPSDLMGPMGTGVLQGNQPDGYERRRNEVSPVPRVTVANDCRITEANPGCMDSLVLTAIPDRWRIVDALPGYQMRWWDPYNRNTIKGDKPVLENLFGKEWFFNVTAVSDTFYESREVVTPVGGSSTSDSGDLDVIGDPSQTFVNQNIAAEFVLYKGDTVFRPPDWEIRVIPVVNWSYLAVSENQVVDVDASEGKYRMDNDIALQAAFVDKHLRNVSDRFDFDSIRVGIQPFSSDFRGFLFQDNQPGVRLFGTRGNNRYQYNLAWFQRLEKDVNSGLNKLSPGTRDDDVFVANIYLQDKPLLGFFSQFSVLYNRNREGDKSYFDKNGFIQRPASLGLEIASDYDVTYLGFSGDGHFGRLNLTTSAYYAIGDMDSGKFQREKEDIRAGFFATEAGVDFDWFRTRFSFLYASGDDDPFDDEANGFDSVFENPQFAGADTSYWIRQSIPLVGGGRVALSQRNGILPSMRSSKEVGQSNFTNPGIWLYGAGADMDLLPELRLSANWNYLRFDKTAVLEVARNQGSIDDEIGHDVSLSLTYRPNTTQNFVIRAAYAVLMAGDGYEDLYGDQDDDPFYFMLNAVLTY
jgi:hypothetical protein